MLHLECCYKRIEPCIFGLNPVNPAFTPQFQSSSLQEKNLKKKRKHKKWTCQSADSATFAGTSEHCKCFVLWLLCTTSLRRLAPFTQNVLLLFRQQMSNKFSPVQPSAAVLARCGRLCLVSVCAVNNGPKTKTS